MKFFTIGIAVDTACVPTALVAAFFAGAFFAGAFLEMDFVAGLGLLMDLVPLKLPSEIVPKLRGATAGFFTGAGFAAGAFLAGALLLPKREIVKLR